MLEGCPPAPADGEAAPAPGLTPDPTYKLLWEPQARQEARPPTRCLRGLQWASGLTPRVLGAL